jgi:hypothetical protein
MRTTAPLRTPGRRAVAHVATALALSVALAAAALLGASPSLPGGPDVTLAQSESSLVVATPTLPIAGKVLPPAKGAYLGVFHPPQPATVGRLNAWNSLARKSPSIVMWYQTWGLAGSSSFDAAQARLVWSRGAVPLINWEPWNPGEVAHAIANPGVAPAYRLTNITRGDFDAYITSYARAVRDAGGPVMLSPLHEMNGTWYPWGGTANGNKPGDFVPAWRHIHDIFEREGATNVTWVWSTNWESVPANSANSYGAYYPGNAYVDWVGVSGFNWGKGSGVGRWRTFTQVYAKPLAYLKKTGKPILISEIASVERGGSKSRWITDAYKRLRTRYPRVRAVIYYNSRDKSHGHVQDWRVTSSKSALKAFRRAVASKYYRGIAPPALAVWRTQQ